MHLEASVTGLEPGKHTSWVAECSDEDSSRDCFRRRFLYCLKPAAQQNTETAGSSCRALHIGRRFCRYWAALGSSAASGRSLLADVSNGNVRDRLANRDSPVRTIRHFTLVCDARTRQRIRLHCNNSDPI